MKTFNIILITAIIVGALSVRLGMKIPGWKAERELKRQKESFREYLKQIDLIDERIAFNNKLNADERFKYLGSSFVDWAKTITNRLSKLEEGKEDKKQPELEFRHPYFGMTNYIWTNSIIWGTRFPNATGEFRWNTNKNIWGKQP